MNKTKIEKEWKKSWEEIWKPAMQTKGQWNERKIKAEIHDLWFIFRQVSAVYCEITGNTLSKPMYYADTIIDEYNDQLNSSYESGFDDGYEEGKAQ